MGFVPKHSSRRWIHIFVGSIRSMKANHIGGVLYDLAVYLVFLDSICDIGKAGNGPEYPIIERVLPSISYWSSGCRLRFRYLREQKL